MSIYQIMISKMPLQTTRNFLEVSESINDSLQILKALNTLAADYLQSRQINMAITYYFEAYKTIFRCKDQTFCLLKEKAATFAGNRELICHARVIPIMR